MTISLTQKKERYYAVINYKENGKQKQKWVALGLPVKNNKRKAEAMLNGILQEYDYLEKTTSSNDKSATNIESICLEYIESKSQDISLSTQKIYYFYLRKLIAPFFEASSINVEDITCKTIEDYYRWVLELSYLKNGVPKKYNRVVLNNAKALLYASLNFAVRKNIIQSNPSQYVKSSLCSSALSCRNCDTVFLTKEEAANLINVTKGKMIGCIITLALTYGLRRGEVSALKWDNIDFNKHTISIDHQMRCENNKWIYSDILKTNTSYRIFPLLPEAEESLIWLKKYQEEQREHLPNFFKDSGFLFANKNGDIMNPNRVYHNFLTCIKKLGMPKMRFHDLRHSTASILYESGWDFKEIQSWMRHAKFDITMNVYTHISEMKVNDMAHDFRFTSDGSLQK